MVSICQGYGLQIGDLGAPWLSWRLLAEACDCAASSYRENPTRSRTRNPMRADPLAMPGARSILAGRMTTDSLEHASALENLVRNLGWAERREEATGNMQDRGLVRTRNISS